MLCSLVRSSVVAAPAGVYHGLPDTQRQAIQRVLQNTDQPLDRLEILHASQTYAPGLGLSTVYRALKALVAQGQLMPITLPGEPTRYEAAGREHHHYFHCRVCQRFYAVACQFTNLQQIVPAGFRLEQHEVILYGLCGICGGRAPGHAPHHGRDASSPHEAFFPDGEDATE